MPPGSSLAIQEHNTGGSPCQMVYALFSGVLAVGRVLNRHNWLVLLVGLCCLSRLRSFSWSVMRDGQIYLLPCWQPRIYWLPKGSNSVWLARQQVCRSAQMKTAVFSRHLPHPANTPFSSPAISAGTARR